MDRSEIPTLMEFNLPWGVPKCVDGGVCHGVCRYTCVNVYKLVHLLSVHPCTEHSRGNRKDILKL